MGKFRTVRDASDSVAYDCVSLAPLLTLAAFPLCSSSSATESTSRRSVMSQHDHEADADEQDPLDWLDDKQSAIVDAGLRMLEASIEDDDLKERLIGAILEELDDWGQEREALKNAPITATRAN